MDFSDAWYAQGEHELEVECTVKEISIVKKHKEDTCANYFTNGLSDDYTYKTIFWYEESKALRFTTDKFLPLLSIQVLADTLFALSFIFNDFFPCTGFLSYITAAIFSNFWFWSAALYDTSFRKYWLALFNLARSLIFILYNDFGCEFSPDLEYSSPGRIIYSPEELMDLVHILLTLYNFYPAMQYFVIDDYLSSKMALVLASSTVAQLVGLV